MSNVNDCCLSCGATIPPVQIPGTAGADGSAGIDAFSTLTSALTLPIVGQNVTANVVSSKWMAVGQNIFIGDGTHIANFKVVSVGATFLTAVLTFLGYTGDNVAGVVMASGAKVSPAGKANNAFTVTLADFTIPTLSAIVTVSVADTGFMGDGQFLNIGGNIFQVDTVNSSVSVDLVYLHTSNGNAAGGNVVTGSKVVSGQANGFDAYTEILSNITIPAVNANTGSITVLDSIWMGVGQNVFASDGVDFGNFSVVSKADSTHVVLKFLGYVGDGSPGAIIGLGGFISPAGVQFSGSFTQLTAYGAGTSYALTNASSAVALGTTSPTVVLTTAGKYMLFASVRLDYNGATFAASRTVTIKLRRTNNTAADISNSSLVLLTPIVTTLTNTWLVVSLPPVVVTTANASDSLSVFIDVNTVPSAGTLDVVASGTQLVALRIG